MFAIFRECEGRARHEASRTILGYARPTFGSSVSLDGDTLVIGAHDNSMGAEGRAYVYELSAGEWVLDATLGTEAGVGVASSKFGVCVGTSDGTVAVGQTPPDQPGRIHIYDKGVSGWELVDTLSPHDPEAPGTLLGGDPPELFGYSLSLSGDRLVGRAAGVAQVFEREMTQEGLRPFKAPSSGVWWPFAARGCSRPPPSTRASTPRSLSEPISDRSGRGS
jgi:hypothetical protein